MKQSKKLTRTHRTLLQKFYGKDYDFSNFRFLKEDSTSMFFQKGNETVRLAKTDE